MKSGNNSLNSRQTVSIGLKQYDYFSLKTASEKIGDLARLPKSIKILAENLLRFEDGDVVTMEDIQAIYKWLDHRGKEPHEIAFQPARILMQDFTGVPAIVDLAAMRDAMVRLGASPSKINPDIPVDLVIDHSVMVDFFATPDAFEKNADKEYERNRERYEFLRWGQKSFKNFRVIPPGTGICHQVNLEYFAKTVWSREDENGSTLLFPDTLVGTDSHTTMINALSVLGWGVGGIEAEAAMLSQPISMMIPEVIGVRLSGKLREGVTATDLVLTLTSILRKHGVVGKFVEFFGSGLNDLALEDRATIANMAPEYGATCGFFPIDNETIRYLRATGRQQELLEVVETYAKLQGLWQSGDEPENLEPLFTETMELDLHEVESSIAGPKRPQDRIALSKAAKQFELDLKKTFGKESANKTSVIIGDQKISIENGDVVIAAITSCTNTSNPSVIIAAGLLAKKAVELGLAVNPKVKTSLAPGSQVVTEYLKKSGLQEYLDKVGFNLVGYGCTTCIGNSGPLPEAIADAVEENDMVVAAVLSGNRNFEGRINPHVKASYLASPPLVIAYALAGSLHVDLTHDPIGKDTNGKPVFLKDIWPSNHEISETMHKVINSQMFQDRYAMAFEGDNRWKSISVQDQETYPWNLASTYVLEPPYFIDMPLEIKKIETIEDAKILAIFGDSITTDHISPAGSIHREGAAGNYLIEKGIAPIDFNSFGSRRGNHEVMIRGTFANIRIKNQMVPRTDGGFTIHYPSGKIMSIYDAAIKYEHEKKALIIFAGKEYGTGSSRDWAAKGTRLLGVKAVIAESFERIHRTNLVGMGVLPLVFTEQATHKNLNLNGSESISIDLDDNLTARQLLKVRIHYADGQMREIDVRCRIDTARELLYYKNGGILPYALRRLAKL